MNSDTRLLVFGREGQIARALSDIVWPSGWRVRYLGRAECDLQIAGAAAAAIRSFHPDLILNAAAYTDVDKAESDEAVAYALNQDAPGEMAAASAEFRAPLIHISSDYVFDGTGTRARSETEPCAPLSVYGASKAAGETLIRNRQPRHLIVRTSWVFSSRGRNFVRTMLRLGMERDELAVADDQIGGPTAATDIAETLMRMALGLVEGSALSGTYHYAGTPPVSRYGFAKAIFDRIGSRGLKVPRALHKIATADYPSPARRPLNSRLDCTAIRRDWGIEQPDWRRSLERCLDKLIPISPTDH